MCAATATGLSLAVPAYFAPSKSWNRLVAAAIAIVNPNSGPGEHADSSYGAAIQQAQQHGTRILGYVHTSYGVRPAAEVLAEAERYLDWYGVNGVFFDEVSSNRAGLPYYAALHRALNARDSTLFIALNPGTRPDERYWDAADVVVTFEGDFASYLSEPRPPWTPRFAPARCWHIVYDVPDAPAMQQVLKLAGERQAGYIYITDGALPNPYSTLPSYWPDELRAAASTAEG